MGLFKSSPKGYFYSLERAFPPSVTIERALQKLLASENPILEKIYRIDHLDRVGIPVYRAETTKEVSSKLGLKESFGKGLTADQAKASALMELVERYSIYDFLERKEEFQIHSFSEALNKTLPVEFLLAPLDEVFREKRFIEELSRAEMLFTPVYDLCDEREILFPLYWFYRIYGTSGWAAGNTLEEATLQALCEVIERHCISKIMEERLEVPTIDPSSIKDPLICEVLERIKKAGIEIFIKDFSLGLGISTIGVISYDQAPPVETVRAYGAAGTHPNPKYALIRALTELLQHRAQAIYSEKINKKPGGQTFCFLKFKTKKNMDFLLRGKKISLNELPSFSHVDFKVELEHLLALLKKAGFRVYLKIATHTILQFPVVMVYIPQARLNRPSTKLHPFIHLSRQYMDMGNYKRAIYYLEEAIKEIPTYERIPQILAQAASCYKKGGDLEKALSYYQKLIEISPSILGSPKFLKDYFELIHMLT